MNTKRLLIQTIPTVGAIGLASCSPVRGGGGGGGGGGGSSSDIFGAWELRFYGYLYDGEEDGYEYPSSYTYEGCTSTTAYFMQIAPDMEVEFTGGTTYDGEDCSDYYSEPYIYRYPGIAEDIGGGTIRITSPDFLNLDCPQSPGSGQMECSWGEETGDDDDVSTTISRWQRTSANNIPEPATDGGGNDDDNAMR